MSLIRIEGPIAPYPSRYVPISWHLLPPCSTPELAASTYAWCAGSCAPLLYIRRPLLQELAPGT